MWSQFVGDCYELLVCVDLKLFGYASPLRRNPALCAVKFYRDLNVRFPGCKAPQEHFLAGGLRMECCMEGWSLPPVREFISERWA
jgi:hypothetical protein